MRRTYRRIAGRYDASLWLFELLGFRLRRWRHRATAALCPREGGTVVDLGCGTGLNLPHLSALVGEGGRVIGVDQSDAMLDQARQRINRERLDNVELVQADMSEWRFPARTDAVLSTFALTIPSHYEQVIRRAADSLKPGARLVFLELKGPDRWPEWLVRLAVSTLRIYGTRWEHTRHKPWEPARQYLIERSFEEFYFGAAYLWVGEKRAN